METWRQRQNAYSSRSVSGLGREFFGAHQNNIITATQCNSTIWTSDRTVWPSGLRRWLKAPVRKGVGSNPTAVTFPPTLLCGSTSYSITWFSPTVSLHSARTHRACAGTTGTCRPHTHTSPHGIGLPGCVLITEAHACIALGFNE